MKNPNIQAKTNEDKESTEANIAITLKIRKVTNNEQVYITALENILMCKRAFLINHHISCKTVNDC